MRNIYKDEINKLHIIESNYNSLFNNNDILEYNDIYSVTNNMVPKRIYFKIKYILYILTYSKYKKEYSKIIEMINNTKYTIDNHNNIVLSKEKNIFKTACGLVENKELDDQQIDAIVRKNNNQLVIAGAGSGKTTTIVGKVKYLLLNEQCNSENILLLSFTNASASEMKERIKKETNVDLDVMTFHKLGLEIIKNSIGGNIKIYDNNLHKLVREIIDRYFEDPIYLEKLTYFLSTARYDGKDEFDFKTEDEYKEYLSSNKPMTLKGEIVKSYGELEIANYLLSNNIQYVYEQEYKYNTLINDYQQYYPDFYLPEYDIYIEYFGIDENNQVAPFFKGKNGLSPSETYNESINWKRKTHRENNTIMIETFYYENKNGKLITNLEENLKKNNVAINRKSNKEIWEIINNTNNGLLNEICSVFSTIINLIKSNEYSTEYLEKLPQVYNSNINKLTLDLIKPIYKEYEDFLDSKNMIDFNDMINMATKCINGSRYIHNYKYVIVDEYQDMSNSRYRLLKAMRQQKDFKLFCVGDDWQSIYRFNGSDIDLITNFQNYWGNTYISYIEKTYRFTSMMSILSGNFIMKNPKQYKKNIYARQSNDFAIKFINGYTENKCIDFLKEKIDKIEKNCTIFFLGRYSFDVNILKSSKAFNMKYNIQDGLTEITYNKRKDLDIKFMTIHKSKGLQADYVFILNNKKYGMGFPSKINDIPLIRLLLSGGLEDYPYSEERRLFYVALTRSKKQTVLLTIENNKSSFADEIKKDYDDLMQVDYELKRNIYKCPKCGGKLVPRKGPYGSFIGCSNYPNCKYIKKY